MLISINNLNYFGTFILKGTVIRDFQSAKFVRRALRIWAAIVATIKIR